MSASDAIHLDVLRTEIDGETAHVIVAPIPDDAPPAVREGLARRRIVDAGGTCPCGARMRVPNRAARRRAVRRREVLRVVVEHEDGCPAPTDVLMRAWGRA